MKKLLFIVLTLALSLFTVSAFAFTPPDKPTNGWYVLDQAGKLSVDEKDKLNQKIENLNKNTKNEYAVLILSTLDGDNIEDAAQDTFRAWGVGKAGLNNGVMVVISVGERKSRIQTGKGVEGDLPDLACKDILDQQLKPQLRKGQFYAGLNDTIDAIASRVESRSAPAVTTSAPPAGGGCNFGNAEAGSGTLLFFLFLTGGVAAGFILRHFLRHFSKVRATKRMIELEAAARRLQQQNLRDMRYRDEVRAIELNRQRLEEASKAKILGGIVPIDYGTSRVPRPLGVPTAPAAKTPVLSPAVKVGLGAVAAASAVSDSARTRAQKEARRRKEEEEAAERRRRDDDAAARRRRDDEEASARRRRDEEPSSSSSSWDSGSSSWDSGGSSFGGGDSGGGGSSSDY